MGLTDAMTRLSDEIAVLRQGREAFRKDLAADIRGKKIAVSEMRTDFARTRAQNALRMKNDLTNFVSKLRGGVAGWRHEFRTDLAGASRAFFGPARGFSELSGAEFSFKPDRKKGRQKSAWGRG